MKKQLLFLTLGLFSAAGFAQKIDAKDVPAAVKQKFATLYPNVKDPKWEKEKGNFEAGFETNKDGEGSVLMDPKGNVLETEAEIAVTQLPKGVAEYVSSHYKGEKIKEASRIKDAKGVQTYEAEIKGKDLIFDSSGKFLHESQD